MPSRRFMPVLMALALVLSACGQGEQQAGEESAQVAGMVAAEGAQVYPNVTASVVFDNEGYIAQKTVWQPGVWSGEHGHPGNQLAIAMNNGTLTYREGGAERDVAFTTGQVIWVDAVETHDHAAKGGPLEALLITLKSHGMGGMATGQQYPSLTTHVVLENDHVIVQHLAAETGKWAGEHSHPGNQLAVVLKGGTTMYREGGEERQVTRETGEVFAVPATQAHDHTAVGPAGEVLLITPKM